VKRQRWGHYAVALAIVVVGLAWAGVPVNSFLIAGLVLVCPLMMLVMMRGMHGGDMPGGDSHMTRADDPNGRNGEQPTEFPGAAELQQGQEQLRRSTCTGETAWTAGATS